MSADEPRLSKYLRSELSEARTDQLWERIQPRLNRPSQPLSKARWAAWGFAVTAAAAWLFVVFFPHQHPLSAWDGTVLETGNGPLSVELQDHSKLELTAHSRVEAVAQSGASAEFRLARGRVECDVTPNPKRKFAVLAGGVEVVVTGTRFSVEYDPSTALTEVAVTRGSVEVRDPTGNVRRLFANERWSLHATPAPHIDVATPAASALAPGAASASVVPLAAPAVSALADETREPVNNPPADAKALFDEAGAARRRGDAAGAARGYEALLSRYPRDTRAGLTAFELARLRMDRLGDPAGALRALKIAIAQAPSASVSEDARARVVDAHQALGQLQACRAAQQTYLNSYPHGIHAHRVASQCSAAP